MYWQGYGICGDGGDVVGGKVLIPTFAVGRAQEICALLDMYWERMGLTTPIYISSGLTNVTNHYYTLYTSWMNEKMRERVLTRNAFEFKHIKIYDKSITNKSMVCTHGDDDDDDQVLLASPGMLHSGLSLDMFKKWCPDPNNLLVIPGYCAPGTAGSKLTAGARSIVLDGITYNVQMTVKTFSFSAHADAAGIFNLVCQLQPKHLILIHGEGEKMETFAKKLKDELGVECASPAENQAVDIITRPRVIASLSPKAAIAASKSDTWLALRPCQTEVVVQLPSEVCHKFDHVTDIHVKNCSQNMVDNIFRVISGHINSDNSITIDGNKMMSRGSVQLDVIITNNTCRIMWTERNRMTMRTVMGAVKCLLDDNR